MDNEADREQRLRELFDRAVTLPPDQRDAVVAAAGDDVLAERLRALLAQDGRGTASVLQRVPGGALEPLRRIGHYELLRELGSGSMGTVVLARQFEPVERLVALKMVGGIGDSQEVLRRFDTERQALALMNHPGIARMFDGGTTDDGVPYFVMEYVRGEQITRYCDRRRLSCAQRLEVFMKVCAAVTHAHLKGVLHRDLKPGNILVTDEGGVAQPKVIDFGVARALSGMAARDRTTDGMVVGTLVYMSPEQAEPGVQDVDTRADVYSLGVVLYELLTGELPLAYDPERDGLVGFHRSLLEVTPPRASERVLALPPARQQEHAAARLTSQAALVRQLHGDLDCILMCVLEKDRNRRYGSAVELAADLKRHRRNEAVLAVPPTLHYRIARFVRRHRLLVAAAAVTLIGLCGGIAGTAMAMFAERDARAAEAVLFRQQARQLRRQTAVGDYFQFLLFYGDPGLGKGPPSLRQLLDQLTPTIAERFAGEPVGEAAVRGAMGRAYLGLGEPTKAEAQLRRAWELEQATSDGTEDAAVACAVLFDLSRARRMAGGPKAGLDELATMLELGGRALAGAPLGLADQWRDLAAMLRRPAVDWSAVQGACDQLLATVAPMALATEPARLTARLLGSVSRRLQFEGHPGSQEFVDRLEAVARHGLGTDVDFLQVVAGFADSQLKLGRFDKARILANEVLDAMARLGVGEHWLQLWAERVRGLALALGGEPAAGETALIHLSRRFGPLSSTASEPEHAAAGVLVELCTRLAAVDNLNSFLQASLQRWLATVGEPMAAPWWPADTDGLPGAAIAAARDAVERAIGTGASPRLQQLLGALLLRQDHTEAASQALESALAGLQPPPPELQADLAIVRGRMGDTHGAAALVAAMRAAPAGAAALEARRQRALQRADSGR